MSIEENPNKSQNEEIRDEIPEGIGMGKQEKTTWDTMNDLADGMNQDESKQQSEE